MRALYSMAILLAALACSCQSAPPEPSKEAKANAPSAQANPHMDAGAPSDSGSPSLADVKAAETAYKTAKGAYTAKADATTKSAYVAATVKLGTTCMTTPALDRKVKYRRALQYYREALKIDPTNAEAKGNSDMIVQIYQQLGRPIPN